MTGAAALGSVGLAGCVGQATGTLTTHVTDQPADIGDFESLIVTIEGIWLGPEGAESGAGDDQSMDDSDSETTDSDGGADDTDGTTGDDADESEPSDADESDPDAPAGREYYEFDDPQQADLVELQGSETQLIDERELSVAAYQFLQLDVSAVDGTLADGSDATVDLPGGAPLTFNHSFEVREDTRTSFTADFAPVRRGTGSYLLRPVPRGIEVTYDSISDGETDET